MKWLSNKAVSAVARMHLAVIKPGTKVPLFENPGVKDPITTVLNKAITDLNELLKEEKIEIGKAFLILKKAGLITGDLDNTDSLHFQRSMRGSKEGSFEYERSSVLKLQIFMGHFLGAIKGTGFLGLVLVNPGFDWAKKIKAELGVHVNLLNGMQQMGGNYSAVRVKIDSLVEQLNNIRGEVSTESLDSIIEEISSIPSCMTKLVTRENFMLVQHSYNYTDLIPLIEKVKKNFSWEEAGPLAEIRKEKLTELYESTSEKLNALYKKHSKNKANLFMPLLKDILDLDAATPLTLKPTNGELYAKLKTILLNLKRALSVRDAYHPALNKKEKAIVSYLTERLQPLLAHDKQQQLKLTQPQANAGGGRKEANATMSSTISIFAANNPPPSGTTKTTTKTQAP